MKRKSFAAFLLFGMMGILLTACQSGTGQDAEAKTEMTAESDTTAQNGKESSETEQNSTESSTAVQNSKDNGTDAVSGASQVFYEASSFDSSQLMEAIKNSQGSCTIATVNEDGTPNIIIAVPGTAGDSHLFFNWADNHTKENVLRTGSAMISYYVYDPEAEAKTDRNKGARLKLSLERDSDVLKQLAQENEGCTLESTVFRIEEILPLG